jgi:hypothetical protein
MLGIANGVTIVDNADRDYPIVVEPTSVTVMTNASGFSISMAEAAQTVLDLIRAVTLRHGHRVAVRYEIETPSERASTASRFVLAAQAIELLTPITEA